MASTRFSAGLVSLYPRESDELQLLLDRHEVAHGRSGDVLTFPAALSGNPQLRHDLAAFVDRSRSNPRGPASRSAVLHLLLTGIGGPDAVELGPEADAATQTLTTFLEQLGRWPEDAFGDIGDPGPEDGFAKPTASRSRPQPERRPRFLAASLASHNEYEDRADPDSVPASTLQEILLALHRLEETQRSTSVTLDGIDARLRAMESQPPNENSEPLALPQESATLPAGAGAATEMPAPREKAYDDLVPVMPSPASEFPDPVLRTEALEKADRGLLSVPAEPKDAATPSGPSPAVLPVSTAVASSAFSAPDTAAVSPAPHFAAPQPQLTPPVETPAMEPASVPATVPLAAAPSSPIEWKSMFAEPEKQSRRRIALLPAVIACLILAAAIVAGIIYFLHSEGTSSQQPTAATEPAAPAPPLSSPAVESSAGGTATSAARTGSASRDTARNQTAPAGATEPQDRVLGARETYLPHSNAEVYPQPKQPSFVAASVMDSRLVYAPPPQHPRVAGLVGLTGMVVLEVTVDSDGTVDTVKVLGGHHLLRDAAVNAVRTWRYRPVLQNGRAVPVRTIVRLDFNRQNATEAANGSSGR